MQRNPRLYPAGFPVQENQRAIASLLSEHIYMLYAYPKNEQEELTAAQKKRLKQVVARWTDE